MNSPFFLLWSKEKSRLLEGKRVEREGEKQFDKIIYVFFVVGINGNGTEQGIFSNID